MIAVMLLLLLLLTTPVFADQTADALTSFGLTGTFADNFSAAPNQRERTNIWSILPSGKSTITLVTRGGQLTSNILQAELISSSKIKLRTESPGNAPIDGILEKVGSGYRVVSSHFTNGTVIVENGTSVSNGYAIPAMFPCGTVVSKPAPVEAPARGVSSSTCDIGFANPLAQAKAPAEARVTIEIPDWHQLQSDDGLRSVLEVARKEAIRRCNEERPSNPIAGISANIATSNGNSSTVFAVKSGTDGLWVIKTNTVSQLEERELQEAEKKREEEAESRRKAEESRRIVEEKKKET